MSKEQENIIRSQLFANSCSSNRSQFVFYLTFLYLKILKSSKRYITLQNRHLVQIYKNQN